MRTVLAGAVGVGVLFTALPASAATPARAFTCSGPLDAVTIRGDLRVPGGVDCLLDGTVVTGSLRIERGGGLAGLSVTVGGSLVSEGARYVAIASCVERDPACHTPSRVGGSVTISGTDGVAPPEIENSVLCDATEIGGAVVLRGNRSRVQLARCTMEAGVRVRGSVTVVDNSGGVDLSYNRIAGALVCRHNEPAPAGTANVVAGASTGQCAEL